MSTPVVRKIKLPPEALAALEVDGKVKFDRPMFITTLHGIRQSVARRVFGPTMKPTFKQQLHTFSSFAAVKASWAANYWQSKMKEKYG